MIAKAFKENHNDFKELVVFASGVPNSNELSDSEFDREFKLLKKIQFNYPSKKLIYFSTSSVESGRKSKYIDFKLKIEDYIKNNFSDFLILRLPIVVGNTNNKDQLIPHIKNKLLNGQELMIKKNCNRFLIDVNDLPKIISFILEKNIEKSLITISFNNKISVFEIFNFFVKKYNISYVNVNFDNNLNFEKDPNNDFFIDLISQQFHKMNINPIKILDKYY